MLVCYTYIFFCKMSIQILSMFFFGLFILILSCKCSLYVLDRSSLSDDWHFPLGVCGYLFHFINSVFWSTKDFNFDEVLFASYFSYGSYFWCHILKLCLTQDHKDFLLSFILKVLSFCSYIQLFELIFFVWCEIRAKIYLCLCAYLVVPAPFVVKTIFSLLNGHGILFQNQLTINLSLFWILTSLPFSYMATLFPITHCFDLL